MNTKEQIMALTDNHQLTIETGLAIMKICNDISAKLHIQSTKEMFSLVTLTLYTTALNIVDEQPK